jgi:hypothetical protein
LIKILGAEVGRRYNSGIVVANQVANFVGQKWAKKGRFGNSCRRGGLFVSRCKALQLRQIIFRFLYSFCSVVGNNT